MTVVSFRVPRELKRRMQGIENENWSQDVRDLIELIVKAGDRDEAMDEVVESFRGRRAAKAGTAAKLMREIRDSN